MQHIIDAARRAMAWDEAEDFRSGYARILYYTVGTICAGLFLFLCVVIAGVFGGH